jgi:UDP-N-acetylmuramoylalanine--D-glutamate ligase
VAVWLNLAPDHLDRHTSLETYAAAKARVFANQRSTDWAVVNADDPIVMRYAESTLATRVTFSLAKPAADGFVLDGDWIVRRTGTQVDRLVPLESVELTGRHMLNNVLAATAVAHIVDVQPTHMRAALSGFHGLEHVMEPVATIGGVRFVNDSKATNVEAACRSIESFGDVVAIVGGHFKGGDLRQLGEVLRGHGRAAVVIGDSTAAFAEALAPFVPVTIARSMREAVTLAAGAARGGGVVLLAPACASFDWFRDYAERGRAFKNEVGRLALEDRSA